jgi:hypothetical protein
LFKGLSPVAFGGRKVWPLVGDGKGKERSCELHSVFPPKRDYHLQCVVLASMVDDDFTIEEYRNG